MVYHFRHNVVVIFCAFNCVYKYVHRVTSFLKRLNHWYHVGVIAWYYKTISRGLVFFSFAKSHSWRF